MCSPPASPLEVLKCKNKPLTNKGNKFCFPKHIFRIATIINVSSSVPVTLNVLLLSAFTNHLLY